MHHGMGVRQRCVWLVAIGLVVLALALSACGGRAAPGSGASGNNPGSSTTTHQSGGSSASGGAMPLDGDLQDVQSLMQQLDAAAGDANFDYSTLDSATVP